MSALLLCTLALSPVPLSQWTEPEAQTLLEVEGGVASDSFGWRALALGDVDGDGAVDFVTCAPLSGVSASAGGFVRAVSGADGATLWQRNGTLKSGILGFELLVADWDGDGTLDVLAAQPFAASGGVVWVYDGASGATLAQLDPGTVGEDGFGCALARGDFDGDGVLDLAVGSLTYDAPLFPVAGRAYVYSGASGLLIAAIDAPNPGNGNEQFGISLAFLGDVSQPPDGRAELAVGERDSGFFSGQAYAYSWSGAAVVAGWTQSGVPMDYGLSGNRFEGGLDVDGDGRGDLLVSATQGSLAEVRSGVDGSLAATFTGGGGDNFGAARLVGDLDGDGRAELLVGAASDDSGAPDAGRAYLYSGAGGAPLRTLTHTVATHRLGREVRPAGDVDGDGLLDFVVAGTGGGTGGPPLGRFLVVRGTALYADYCATNANSSGAPAAISAAGQASLAQPDLVTFAAPVPDEVGLFFHGSGQVQLPFGNGVLCIGGQIVRGGAVFGAGHVASYAWDGSSALKDLSPFVGQTRHVQYWFRDTAGGGAQFNTSNALTLEVVP